GFDPREPLSVMHGAPIRQTPAGYTYRRADPEDMEACAALCRRVHGHHRSGELGDMITMGAARVLERDRRNGRLHLRNRLFRAFGGGEQRRPAGAHRQCGGIAAAWLPAAHAQRRRSALVPGTWPARGRAHDAHEHGPLQRARRRVAAVYLILTILLESRAMKTL